MPWNQIPNFVTCCVCISDLKTAAAIIAVLGIVSSPAVSWAFVRHAYVIRVSCLITTSSQKSDVVDVNLYNVISFGFGANAGVGPTCLGSVNQKNNTDFHESFMAMSDALSNSYTDSVNIVRYMGWFVFIADLVFVGASTYFLIKLLKEPNLKSAKWFLVTGIITILMSFFYGMVYVYMCSSNGSTFAVFEFLFAFVDLILWFYFFIVVNSYIRSIGTA